MESYYSFLSESVSDEEFFDAPEPNDSVDNTTVQLDTSLTHDESNEEFYDAQERKGFADNTIVQSDTSLTQDSDEIQEMYCEECEKHNKYKPANGFCVNCVEYKCAMCINFHKQHLKNHSLLDHGEMPKDFFYDRCTKHSMKLIKFYCLECETPACLECRNSNHMKCSKVKHLPSLVMGIEPDKELTVLQDNLETLSNDIEKVKTKLEAKANISFSMEAKAKVTIKEHKEHTINAYKQHQKKVTDEFDQEMEETIAKLKAEREKFIETLEESQKTLERNLVHSEKDVVKILKGQRKTLEALKEKALSVTSDLKSFSSDLTQTKASDEKCRLFIKIKNSNQRLEKLKKDLLYLQKKDIKYYKIEPLQKQVSTDTLESQTTFFSFKEYKPFKFKTAKFCKDIVLKESKNSIKSLCLLSENKLVAANNLGRNLIVFKNLHNLTKSYDIINMSAYPWDITKIDDNKVAVTFPYRGIVRLITFTDSMSVISTDDIQVGEECHGIAYCNNNLIVSYSTYPGKVQILNMSGQVLKCFDKDSNGKCLFNRPEFLTLSPDNTTIYVSNCGSKTVISMTIDGDVKAIYRGDKLWRPCQLTVDDAGTVYVCGNFSDNVQQLSSCLIKGNIILDKSDVLYRPQGIAYCQKNDRLYVGMSDCIKVFSVSEV